MSAISKDPTASYADLLRVPARLVAEILGGELVTHPRPAPKHARASSALGGELYGPFDRGRGGPGGWIILDEPELHLGTDVIVPDLAGWRRGRMPHLPETAFFETAPDWVCEVTSPATELYDRGTKRLIYAREGVSSFWLLDPRLEMLEVFTLRDGSWVLAGTFSGTCQVMAPPFEAVGFSLGELWSSGQQSETGAGSPATDDN